MDYKQLLNAAETARFCIYAKEALAKHENDKTKCTGTDLRTDLMKRLKECRGKVGNEKDHIPHPIYKKK